MMTTQLIDALSADAASPPRRVGRALVMAALAGAAAAAAVFAARLGVRPDAAEALGTLRFPFKFLVTGVLFATAAALTIALAKPGRRVGAAGLAMAAAPLLLIAAVAVELTLVPGDRWMTTAVGRMSRACLVNIPLIAALPLAGVLLALRRGAPSSPALSGAVAGVLSGALAATFYAANCPDDSPLFVALWYPIAIALVAGVGALAGARVLRW